MTNTCGNCKHEKKRMNESPCKEGIANGEIDCWEAKEDDVKL